MKGGDPETISAAKNTSAGVRTRKRATTSLFAQGEPMIWLTGGGLVIALVMISGLISLIFAQGIVTLWPQPIVRYRTHDGRALMGEVTREESYRPQEADYARLAPADEERERKKKAARDGWARRRLLRTGNFELTGEHFNWISDLEVSDSDLPEWAVIVERLSWGRFYGIPKAFLIDGEQTASGAEAVWSEFQRYFDGVVERRKKQRHMETVTVGELNLRLEHARLNIRRAEIVHGSGSAEHKQAEAEYEVLEKKASGEFARIQHEVKALRDKNEGYQILFEVADGRETKLSLAEIVRAYPANRLSFPRKIAVYGSRWIEFLTAEPREANSEGGVFPAIFGTVVMTVLMSLAVVPFGVMAALYLREYAKAGPVVSAVRIAINNLAGVPSIVFGVFGLGFFCYMVGASIDQLLFAEKLPNPTYGKGGILWASFTLALMTLPVVIVATEEALSAVPNSMREGSYACGASKWQTIRRIILPRALPGIMTGMILAMARGAGEVAPLMLVGAVKLAPELPIDRIFPYIHPERSFMHLGFHIYDLGFQSQNSEAAKPMVFTTTLLLITIVALLNVFAVRLRTRLRRKFVSSVF